MLISKVINNIKQNCTGYGSIDDSKSRDQILFGSTDKECTGIVFCLWANKTVIERAHALNANLIISHEALFWNHGDHTKWLDGQNRVYSEKKELLNKYNLTIWRFHDYIHSGIETENRKIQDGIFYGLSKKLGWEDYLKFDSPFTANFTIPQTKALDASKYILKKLGLKESRVVGNLNHDITEVGIPFHILDQANREINYIDQNDVGLIVTMELNDFTLAQYIHDNSDYINSSTILSLGHFNVEQPGMEFASQYFRNIIKNNVHFVDIGDYYDYLRI